MRLVVVVAGLLSLASAARAGDVFAVLPTESTGDVSAQAALVSTVMLGVLQEASLAVVGSEAMGKAVVDAGPAACSSPVACARVVGPVVNATKVVVSELWALAPGFQLRVAVVDLRAGAAPSSEDWLSFSAADKAALTQAAEQAVLAVLKIERSGSVVIGMSEVGAEVLIDGVAMGPTPMLTPLTLKAGRHEIEIRYGQRTPWRGFVEVEAEKTSALKLCANAAAVVDVCGDPPSAGPSPLFLGSAVGAGVGVASVVTGGVLALLAGASLSAYGERAQVEDKNNATTLQAISVVTFGVGGVLVAAGGAGAAASMLLE